MKLKDIARRVPGVRRTYRAIYNLLLRMRSTEDVFTDIYKKNRWYGTESVSGLGSESSQTQIISRAIPELIVEYGIRTVHDIPCGDFFWMSRIDLGEVDYLGSDIVGELIESKRAALKAFATATDEQIAQRLESDWFTLHVRGSLRAGRGRARRD